MTFRLTVTMFFFLVIYLVRQYLFLLVKFFSEVKSINQNNFNTSIGKVKSQKEENSNENYRLKQLFSFFVELKVATDEIKQFQLFLSPLKWIFSIITPQLFIIYTQILDVLYPPDKLKPRWLNLVALRWKMFSEVQVLSKNQTNIW